MAIAFTRSDHVRKAYLSPSAATALAERLREHNYANEPAKIEYYTYIYIPVSYTHLRAHETDSLSRMPSSA